LELLEAFKIENNVLLRDFESSLRRHKNSFLKGLFVPLSKKSVLQLSLFGFKTPKTPEENQSLYRSKFLRIPQVFLKNNQSVVEKLLIEEQSAEDFSGPILRAYTSPTCEPLRDKMQRHEGKEVLCCFVLCRVIIVDQSSEKSKTYFNQAA
jgi:hypothetical protein